MATREQLVEEALARRVQQVFPSPREARERLRGAAPLKIYLGIDPTGPSIHIGHTVALFFLRKISELGHRPVVVIGDFTARIGDPSDKTAARQSLTKDEVLKNMEHYLEQIEKIIPRKSFDVRYNSEWLSPMTLENVIHLASRATVQQMIARDMFQERIKNEKPIFVHELLYPLMQGYDSVSLAVDGEVGGNDQTFNMLFGRELEKEMLGKDKLVFALRLLVDASSGKKMSKSEGDAIAVNDTPEVIFEKVGRSIPNEMIKTVFELCTDMPQDEIDRRYARAESSGEWKKYNTELASELVRIYHGQDAAQRIAADDGAMQAFRVVGEKTPLWVVIKSWQKMDSSSAAKRLIEQRAIEVNGELETNWARDVQIGDVITFRTKKVVIQTE